MRLLALLVRLTDVAWHGPMARRGVILAFTWVMGATVATSTPAAAAERNASGQGRWIWADPDEPAPKNRFTYFRKTVELATLPEDATLRFAADSNGWLWINGQVVRRKVARYHEPHATAERIDAAPYLREGKNVVVVLHHNWGDIVTFQRTANLHAGLYLDSAWVRSDASWRCRRAPEFAAHDKQILGLNTHPRIRYPVLVDGQQALGDAIHRADYDDRSWSRAIVVEKGPWPDSPEFVETPGQREYPVTPTTLLAAGEAKPTQPLSDDPLSIASGIRTAELRPTEALHRAVAPLLDGRAVTLEGQAGRSLYVTFDFARPVHGYPFLEIEGGDAGVVIDFGYGELSRAVYSGEMHVDAKGWVNTEGVVGRGYGDRYVTRDGPQRIELPDERTARWLTLHLHFKKAGRVVFSRVGIVKSQYPIDPIGSFHCGDEQIDQIVKLCLIHAEVTMSDSYIDTPGREDGQWIEDSRPRMLLTARWFGDIKLRQFALRTLIQSQGKDGQLHPFAPSNYPAYPAPYDWSVQWVGMLWDDYVWTGRTERIERYWEPLRRYWQNVLSHVREDGLWCTAQVLADIRVGVRLNNPRQSSGIVTPWIIERLGWSIDMAKAVGRAEQAGEWQTIRDKMTRAFRDHHVVPAAGRVPAHVGDRFDPEDTSAPRGYSQAGQTIALTSGLLTREQALADLTYAFGLPDGSPPAGVTRWNNPTYSYRSLRALSAAGLTRRAVAHLKERYAPYLPGHPRNPIPLVLQGSLGGPLPEYWISREDLGLEPGQVDTAQPADETGSHGWQAVPLLWLHDSLLGVTLDEPGGGKITIAPDAGGLPFVAGNTMTPKGVVWVNWQPTVHRLEVRVPDNVLAHVVLPSELAGRRTRVTGDPDHVKPTEPNRYDLDAGGTYVFQAN